MTGQALLELELELHLFLCPNGKAQCHRKYWCNTQNQWMSIHRHNDARNKPTYARTDITHNSSPSNSCRNRRDRISDQHLLIYGRNPPWIRSGAFHQHEAWREEERRMPIVIVNTLTFSGVVSCPSAKQLCKGIRTWFDHIQFIGVYIHVSSALSTHSKTQKWHHAEQHSLYSCCCDHPPCSPLWKQHFKVLEMISIALDFCWIWLSAHNASPNAAIWPVLLIVPQHLESLLAGTSQLGQWKWSTSSIMAWSQPPAFFFKSLP